MNYFTLRALAHEWNDLLSGGRMVDIWTQSANELSVSIEKGGARHTIRVLCDPKLPLLFRSDGYGRARKNSVTIFEGLPARQVVSISCAERDRFVFVELDKGTRLQIQLFGSRPNVYLVHTNEVNESFLHSESWIGKTAPQPRPSPPVETLDAFRSRWREYRKTLAQALSTAIPLFDRQLAEEAVHRSGIDTDRAPTEIDADELRLLFDSSRQILIELEKPNPVLYWRGGFVEHFALTPLESVSGDLRAEPFESVDAAFSVFARRSLAQRRFMEAFKPIEAALDSACRKRSRSADAMLAELGNPSRAEKYEAWGHLLMAQAAGHGAGHEEITLPDILGDGGDVTIRLDPAKSAIENAQHYYEKARRTREARKHAERRWQEIQAEAHEAEELLDQLRALEGYSELETFLSSRKNELAPFVSLEAAGEERLPYRRYNIEGWEIRAGRNAKSNAILTTKHSSPHDLWLHARGVSGSHVVVRRPAKTSDIPRNVVETAARIAAHFSDAKTQSLAPVIVTERKYVRPVKGGPPGLVRVDREEVVLVEPGLPD